MPRGKGCATPRTLPRFHPTARTLAAGPQRAAPRGIRVGVGGDLTALFGKKKPRRSGVGVVSRAPEVPMSSRTSPFLPSPQRFRAFRCWLLGLFGGGLWAWS